MKKHFVAALALAVAPFAASAGDLSYNYVDGAFARVNTEIDGSGDIDFDGFQLRGSADVGAGVNLFGGYSTVNNDDGGFDTDLNELQAGVGYHHALSDKADVLAELSWINSEIEADGIEGDGDDVRASVGFRGAFSNNFEGLIKANYTDGDVYDGSFSVTLGAQVKFNQTWGLIGEAEFGNSIDLGGGLELDTTKYLLGVRASF